MWKVRTATLCVCLTLLICAAVWIAPHLAMSSLPTETPARVRLTQVTVGEVAQRLAVSGRVRGEAEFAVLAPQAGIVDAVYVSAGEHVRSGAPLARMDGALAVQQLSQALARTQTVPTAALPEEVRGALSGTVDSQLSQGETLLSGLTLRAPADGVVAQVLVSEHGGAAAGTPAFLMCSEAQKIVCPVVVRDAAQVAPGMTAALTAGGESVGEGVVRSVSPASVDENTGQTVCEVAIAPNAPIDLPLGAAVDAEILLWSREGVPIVPLSAVTEAGTVWWAADGRCYEIPAGVTLADEMNGWTMLPAGTRVVDGAPMLVEGQRIKELKP